MVYELLIPKWEKYNPRSDVKSSTWLRLSNDFFSDPDFYGTSLSLRMVYLYILCAASKKMNKGLCKINIRMASDQLSMQEKEIKKHLSELILMNLVQMVEDSMIPARSDSIGSEMLLSATNERTDERTNTRTRENSAPLEPSFEGWIQAYQEITGKKDGNTAAVKKLIQARTKEGFALEDCSLVVQHKNDQWKGDDKMSQYIRPTTLFSTKFETYLDEAKNRSGDVLDARADAWLAQHFPSVKLEN